jgi:phosphatidylserine decarboxylase
MTGLAHGGHAPVLITFMMGVSSIIVGSLIDPLSGLVPLFGILCLMASAFFVNFWRDPDRPIPKASGILVSPADGHVMFIRRERATGHRPSKKEHDTGLTESDPLSGDWMPSPCETPLSFATEQRFEAVAVGDEDPNDVVRIAVFMSPLDVHVNRAPMASTIERMEHRTGKGLKRGPFLAAYKKESEYNERVRTVFLSNDGVRIEVTQISGALARTIIPWQGIGDEMRRGQRYGMIRLGSRVDVRVPAQAFTSSLISAEMNDPRHPKGQFVQAGASILFHPKA